MDGSLRWRGTCRIWCAAGNGINSSEDLKPGKDAVDIQETDVGSDEKDNTDYMEELMF